MDFRSTITIFVTYVSNPLYDAHFNIYFIFVNSLFSNF